MRFAVRVVSLTPLLGLALAALPAGARTWTRSTSRNPALTPNAANPGTCVLRTPSGHCLPNARCAENELDLDGFCLPTRVDVSDEGSAELTTNSHVDRSGQLVVYEHLPLRPDLPSSYDRYEYPVPAQGDRLVSSGYDLGLPDALQRRGADLLAVGHGGFDLPRERGTPVQAMSLRGQVGDPTVVYAGHMWGTTVILQHVVREGAMLRSYIAINGHLDSIAPGLARRQTVVAGTTVGFVGDTGSEGKVHLHYELRLVRPGIDPLRVDVPTELIHERYSVACDPRNLLPLRPAAR